MKHILLFLTVLLSINAFSQDISRDEIDEFTNKHVVESEWITLNKKSKLYSYCRIIKIDTKLFLDFKFMAGNKVLSINEGPNLLFKSSDGSIIKLNNLTLKLSSYGAGSTGLAGSKMLGVNIKCEITESQLKQLQNSLFVKTRVNTSEGYIEAEIKEKQAKKLMKTANLF